MPSQTGGSDLHPYFLQRKDGDPALPTSHDPPPAYSAIDGGADVSGAHNNQTLDVSQLPKTYPTAPMAESSPATSNTPYSPGSYPQYQQSPGSQYPSSPYQQQQPRERPSESAEPTTPRYKEQNVYTPSPSHQPSKQQIQQNTQSHQYESVPPRTPKSQAQYQSRENRYSTTSYDNRKQSTNADEDEAGFENRQTRSRMISSSSQGQPQSGMRDQYGNVYDRQQRSYDQRSPTSPNQPPIKSPVAKDLSQYYDKQPTNTYSNQRGYNDATLEQGSRDYYSPGGRGRNYSDGRSQYENGAYVQDSPSYSQAPPPPQRGYSVERTQAYKQQQQYQSQNLELPSYNQSTQPRSPRYQDQRDYSLNLDYSQNAAAYNNRPDDRYLQFNSDNPAYLQSDTFI